MRISVPWKIRSVSVDGFKGRYLKSGSGPTIVIIASPLIFATTYKPVLRALSKTHTVYVFEMPGSGFSSMVDRPWTLDEYARWLAKAFEKMKTDTVTLIGHSNSGPIAIAFALAFPEKLKKLVLADSTGVFPRSGSLIRILLGRIYDSWLEPWLTAVGSPALLFNFIRHTRTFIYQVWLAPRLDIRKLLPYLKVETLIAWGKRDHTVPKSCARELQECIPRAEFMTSSKGSHDWLIERAEEFAKMFNMKDKQRGRGERPYELPPRPEEAHI